MDLLGGAAGVVGELHGFTVGGEVVAGGLGCGVHSFVFLVFFRYLIGLRGDDFAVGGFGIDAAAAGGAGKGKAGEQAEGEKEFHVGYF